MERTFGTEAKSQVPSRVSSAPCPERGRPLPRRRRGPRPLPKGEGSKVGIGRAERSAFALPTPMKSIACRFYAPPDDPR